ncbi:hypothetical protein LUZ60_002026 [Juncus effusus]|nr:hypothetical protein LUZ60_002026 [Juncus effusus]
MCGLCCCPCPEDFEEYAHPNNPIYRQCLCLRFFFHQLFTGYNTAFQRLDSRSSPAPSSTHQPNPPNPNPNSPAAPTNPNSFHLVPRPLPFSHLISRREKSQPESQQPLRKTGSSSDFEGKKRSSADFDADGGKMRRVGSERRICGAGLGFGGQGEDEEDVCPTCLEEYTAENPKIITKCSHHFHLGCIYEWMERSDNCPICGQEMEFCESP